MFRLVIPVSLSSILLRSICQSVIAKWSSMSQSCSIVTVVKYLLTALFYVTHRSSSVPSIPSTSVSSHCRLSLTTSCHTCALLSETTSESEHLLWPKSRIGRLHTKASVGSYKNRGFVLWRVGRELLQQDR